MAAIPTPPRMENHILCTAFGTSGLPWSEAPQDEEFGTWLEKTFREEQFLLSQILPGPQDLEYTTSFPLRPGDPLVKAKSSLTVDLPPGMKTSKAAGSASTNTPV